MPAQPGGLGEEDMVTLVLPYAKSARDGVRILGDLLERYGTYENNGIAFSDVDEIWWLETIGGHHWIAKRVPDDAYVTMPNQLGIDSFDLDDAEGAQADHMCSADLRSWMAEWHLDLTLGVEATARLRSLTRARPLARTATATTSTTRRAPGTCSAASTPVTCGMAPTPTTRPRATISPGAACPSVR